MKCRTSESDQDRDRWQRRELASLVGKGQVGFTVGNCYTHAGVWVCSGTTDSLMAGQLMCAVKSRSLEQVSEVKK